MCCHQTLSNAIFFNSNKKTLLICHDHTLQTGIRLSTQRISVLAKIISGLPDKMSGRSSMLCRTFWSAAGHFSALMTGKYYILCRTFLAEIFVYRTLLDKMSGNFRTLCRTSAGVCRTCPACPAYFARTGIYPVFYSVYKSINIEYRSLLEIISHKWSLVSI